MKANKDTTPAAEMTMRHYFAAHALQGLLAAESENFGFPGRAQPEGLAERAVEIADALMEALAK